MCNMHFGLTKEDLQYGGLTVGAFVIVAAIGYPLAVIRRHSDELRDAIPMRCVAMHFAGFCFVMHDWISWHNSRSACPVLSVLEAFAATVFFCTLLWKHHLFYVRHVADRADHRFTIIAVLGAVAFIAIGAVRLMYSIFEDYCLKLDAAVSFVGLVQLVAGIVLFHRVRRLPGASWLLNFAIRFELGVAVLAVIVGIVKQWAVHNAASEVGSDVTIALLSIMSIAFNASFVLFLAPALPCCKGHFNSSFDSALLGTEFEPSSGRINSGVHDSVSRYSAPGSGGNTTASAGPASRGSTARIADHFQGRLERLVHRLIGRIKDGRSERAVRCELERALAGSNLPAKLVVNGREEHTGRTLLHYAAAVGYADVVARLIEFGGSDLEHAADAQGLEPLHAAAIGPEAADLPAPDRTLSADDVLNLCNARATIVRDLVRSGARVSTQAPDGRRALHYAAQHAPALSSLVNLVSPSRGPATPHQSMTTYPSGGGGFLSASTSGSSGNYGAAPGSVPPHLRVVEALLIAHAKQEVATPSAATLYTMAPDVSGMLGGGFCDADRKDIEWHHVVNRGNAAHKTPLAIAVEADDAGMVLLMLRHLAKAHPQLAQSPSTSAAGLSGVARRSGLVCTQCSGASILHIALAAGARRVCELLLAPQHPLAMFGNQSLPPEDANVIANIVWPMLGCRTESAHGMNVFHAAALAGDPATVTLLLHALTARSVGGTPSSSKAVSPVRRTGNAPSWPATPRTGGNGTQTPSPVVPTAPSSNPGAGGGLFPAEGVTGSLLIVPNPRDSAAWADNEGRLQQMLAGTVWSRIRAADQEAFASAASAGRSGACANAPRCGMSPSVAAARKEAAVKALKNAGFPTADRLARMHEGRHADPEELVALSEVVRADALKRLSGTETRLDPSRAQADAVIAATVSLLHQHLCRLQPYSFAGPPGGGRSRRNKSGAGGSSGLPPGEGVCLGRNPTNASLASAANSTTGGAVRPLSPGSGSGHHGPGTNVWSVIIKLLDARAFEFGAQYCDGMAPQVPLDIAGSRGHLEMCRVLAATHRVAVLQVTATVLQATPLMRGMSSPSLLGNEGRSLNTGGGPNGTPPTICLTSPSTMPSADFDGGASNLNLVRVSSSSSYYNNGSVATAPRRSPDAGVSDRPQFPGLAGLPQLPRPANDAEGREKDGEMESMSEAPSDALFMAPTVSGGSSRIFTEVRFLRACVAEGNRLGEEASRALVTTPMLLPTASSVATNPRMSAPLRHIQPEKQPGAVALGGLEEPGNSAARRSESAPSAARRRSKPTASSASRSHPDFDDIAAVASTSNGDGDLPFPMPEARRDSRERDGRPDRSLEAQSSLVILEDGSPTLPSGGGSRSASASASQDRARHLTPPGFTANGSTHDEALRSARSQASASANDPPSPSRSTVVNVESRDAIDEAGLSPRRTHRYSSDDIAMADPSISVTGIASTNSAGLEDSAAFHQRRELSHTMPPGTVYDGPSSADPSVQ